jgi:regulator of cell morphogenesis and NO signaling
MSVLVKQTIGEIAASNPHAAKLFDLVGIDYCGHGNLTLRDACADAGLNAIEIRNAVQQLPRDASEKSWLDQPLSELVAFLRNERHPALRRSLTHAAALFAEVCDVGTEHPVELDEARVLFNGICDEIHPHIIHEEHVIFPVAEHLEECWANSEKPSMTLMGGLHRPMALLVLDHEDVLARVARSRAIVESYPGDDARWMLRDALLQVERDLKLNIHLENNVLFPRATALEIAVANDVRKPAPSPA